MGKWEEFEENKPEMEVPTDTNETPEEPAEENAPMPAEEGVTEEPKTPEESAAEEMPAANGSIRERVIEFGRNKYPEDYAEDEFDDDKYTKLVDRLLNDSKKRDEDYEKLHKSSTELFKSFEEHPDTMQVFENIKNGMDLKSALYEVYGRDYIDAESGSEDEKRFKEEFENAKKKREEIVKNLDVSDAERKKYYEEAGMTDDEIARYEEAEKGILDAIFNGKYNKDYFDAISNHINRAKDMEAARTQGEITGRNAVITEKMREDVGDGMPHKTDGNGAKKSAKKENTDSTTELYSEINDSRKKSIWE